MAYKILTTVYSEQDLDSILGYMIRELHAPQAATDFADAVGACYDRLSEMPALYELSGIHDWPLKATAGQ